MSQSPTETVEAWELEPGRVLLVPMCEAIETISSTNLHRGYVTVETAEGSRFQWPADTEVNVMVT